MSKEWKWRIYKAGLNQETFAALIGIPASHLSRLVNGYYKPNARTIKKVENAFERLGV